MIPISSVAETYNKGSILSHNIIVHRFLTTLQFSQVTLIIYSMWSTYNAISYLVTRIHLCSGDLNIPLDIGF